MSEKQQSVKVHKEKSVAKKSHRGGAHGERRRSSHGASAGNGGHSQVEQALRNAQVPLEINETEEASAHGERGILLNKAEIQAFRGDIRQYELNQDSNPEVIKKRAAQISYTQDIAVKYLQPPTPAPPGEIIIKQECNTLTPPAPPLIIRQVPGRSCTPEPLIIREAPPPKPCTVCQKVITVPGKKVPPPPRRVIIERLPNIPNKPQPIVVERWLPHKDVKRRVIFQGCPNQPSTCGPKPRNLILQWDAPDVVVKQQQRCLGVTRANPEEYIAKYGSTLKAAKDLPKFVLDIKSEQQLAADKRPKQSCDNKCVFELEGDLHALKLVDLDREGLSEYKDQLARLGH